MILISNALLIAAEIATYLIIDEQNPINPKWAVTVLNLCNHTSDQAFHHASLKSIGKTVMFVAAYLGVLFQSKFMNGQNNIRMPTNRKALKTLGRVCVLILIVVPWAALMFIPKIKNIWLSLIIQNALASFGLIFTLTSVYDHLCLKLKLYDYAAPIVEIAKIDEAANFSIELGQT